MFEFSDFPNTQSLQSIAGGTPFVKTVSGNIVSDFFQKQDEYFTKLVTSQTAKSGAVSTNTQNQNNNLPIIMIGGLLGFLLYKFS
jgi:hypothetical protein